MQIRLFADHFRKEVSKIITGQAEVVDQVILGLLASGHVILEGVPGLAKTLLARTFSRVLDVPFNRIQFTPDLLPSDITGTNVFNLKDSTFEFKRGPVFAGIILADEINRASPRTQAALLEVMQERQVTIDGVTYPVPEPFMVLATQNPVEFEGTFPLPEAQLDRFMMKIKLSYPSSQEEEEILRRIRDGFDAFRSAAIPIQSTGLDQLAECRKEALTIRVDDSLITYIREIIEATRKDPSILLGASTRASVVLLNLARFQAGLQDRDYVVPDDVKQLVLPVLRHRLVLQADAEVEGMRVESLIQNLLETVKVPR